MPTIGQASLCVLLTLGTAWANSSPPYKNSHLPVEQRVSDLLGRMTIEDKMAQLMQGTFRIDRMQLSEDDAKSGKAISQTG
jgi:beta-glucosidase